MLQGTLNNFQTLQIYISDFYANCPNIFQVNNPRNERNIIFNGLFDLHKTNSGTVIDLFNYFIEAADASKILISLKIRRNL